MTQRRGTAYHRAIHRPVPGIEWTLARHDTVQASIAAIDRRIVAGGYRTEAERTADLGRRSHLVALLRRAPVC